MLTVYCRRIFKPAGQKVGGSLGSERRQIAAAEKAAVAQFAESVAREAAAGEHETFALLSRWFGLLLPSFFRSFGIGLFALFFRLCSLCFLLFILLFFGLSRRFTEEPSGNCLGLVAGHSQVR